MQDSAQMKLPLSPYRVLDLSDEKGFLCGKVFADMGADVIKIEPPAGDEARTIGPFYHDIAEPENSLFWLGLNTNKRAITLNLESEDGRAILLRLAKTADFLVESFVPGRMDEWDVGYSALHELNPRLIFISISPFGQAGPYRDLKGSDIVAMAMGGLMNLSGDSDRAPVQIAREQANYHGSLQGVVGGMIAHYWRSRTGEGQHVDVSMQESVTRTLLLDLPVWAIHKRVVRRTSNKRAAFGTLAQHGTWPCVDGHVTWRLMTGPAGSGAMEALVAWMRSEGAAGKLEEVENWAATDSGSITQEQMDEWEDIIRAFFLTHTKEALYTWAQEKGVPLTPVNTVADAVALEQLKARNFWVEVSYPKLGASITQPGPFCKSTQPMCEIYRRAPSIGEHNAEILRGELGLSGEELAALQQRGAV